MDAWVTAKRVWGSATVSMAVVFGGMYGLATSYYLPLRQLLAGKDGQPPIGPEALATYLIFAMFRQYYGGGRRAGTPTSCG